MILEAFVNSGAWKTGLLLFGCPRGQHQHPCYSVFPFFPLTQRLISILSVERVLSYVVWAACLKSSFKIGSQDVGSITLNFLGD